MSWLSLASLAWLSLLAPLFALYVLRPSRVDKVVPSTFLWTTVARELSARHPWQRLRPFVSLLIQALALIAGALALARPSCGAGAPVGETIVVIVDASISMSARDRGGTRIEVAAERAAALTRGLGVGGHVMVIAAGPSPTLRLGPSRDASRVRQLVAQTPLVGASPRFDAAIELAAARLRAHRGPKRIVVLSDGAVTEPIVAASGIATSLERVGATRDLENVALVAADIRAREDEPTRVEIFARVEASGPRAHTLDVVVTGEGGALLGARRVTVRPGTPESIVTSATLPLRSDGAPSTVRIALMRPDGAPWQDALAVDDAASRIGAGPERLAVLLVGDVSASVVRGLRADTRVEAFAVPALAYARRLREGTAFEGLVVLGHDAPGPMPGGPAMLIAPDAPSAFGLVLDAPVASARVVTFDRADPRMRFGAPEDASLSRLRAVRSGLPLVTTDRGVAIARVRHADGEALVLGFDPDQSDFVREPSFVLFLHDVVSEAARQRTTTEVADGRIGEALRVRARGVRELVVRTPSGRSLTRPVTNGVAIVDVPEEEGVYTIRTGTRVRRVVRALLDEEESDLTPRLTLRRGRGVAAADVRVPAERREWLPILALALLVLLVADAAWARRTEAS